MQRFGFSTTILHCVPAFFNFTQFYTLEHVCCLPFAWGQVSSSQVSISTARRRSDRQFRPVHAEYASALCPRCNLHIQDQQLDSGGQVGKHDGGTGPSRERLWWSQQCSHPKATEGTRPKPHALRRSWMVQSGNRMVLRTEPFLATPAHWQPWRVRRWKNTERTSSDDTGSFWRQNERSCIHPQKWCDSSDSTSEESLPWEGGVLQNLPQGELRKLAESLKYYAKLKSLEVLKFECSEDEATSFGKAQQLGAGFSRNQCPREISKQSIYFQPFFGWI